jgi:hypothetical protein
MRQRICWVITIASERAGSDGALAMRRSYCQAVILFTEEIKLNEEERTLIVDRGVHNMFGWRDSNAPDEGIDA